MSWAAKRFWREARVVEAEAGEGFAIRLDARALKTPGKAEIVAPSRAAAEAAAAEWDAVEELVDPGAMPVTRYLNTAIDRVAPQVEAVRAEVAGYGGSDLICYRAAHPEALAARQAQVWDPLMLWSAEALGAPLAAATGVMHVDQPGASLAALADHVAAHDIHALAVLHDLVSITGSLVIGLALSHGRLGEEEAWAVSRVDETWQIERWGADEEAEAVAIRRRAALGDAMRVLALLRG